MGQQSLRTSSSYNTCEGHEDSRSGPQVGTGQEPSLRLLWLLSLIAQLMLSQWKEKKKTLLDERVAETAVFFTWLELSAESDFSSRCYMWFTTGFLSVETNSLSWDVNRSTTFCSQYFFPVVACLFFRKQPLCFSSFDISYGAPMLFQRTQKHARSSGSTWKKCIPQHQENRKLLQVI